jgi:hypothetical protein
MATMVQEPLGRPDGSEMTDRAADINEARQKAQQ